MLLITKFGSSTFNQRKSAFDAIAGKWFNRPQECSCAHSLGFHHAIGDVSALAKGPEVFQLWRLRGWGTSLLWLRSITNVRSLRESTLQRWFPRSPHPPVSRLLWEEAPPQRLGWKCGALKDTHGFWICVLSSDVTQILSVWVVWNKSSKLVKSSNHRVLKGNF